MDAFYPLAWEVEAATWVRHEDSGVRGGRTRKRVGRASVYIFPDTSYGGASLLLSRGDNRELTLVADTLEQYAQGFLDRIPSGGRPGGDVMYVASVDVEPEFRGRRYGRAIVQGALRIVGRGVGLVAIKAVPAPGSLPEGIRRADAKRALAEYWKGAGFARVSGDLFALVTAVRSHEREHADA